MRLLKRHVILHWKNVIQAHDAMRNVKPEQKARQTIDNLLTAASWQVQNYAQLNLGAGPGIAGREYPLKTRFADYLLFVNRKALGVVEAKAVGTPLSGITDQS